MRGTMNIKFITKIFVLSNSLHVATSKVTSVQNYTIYKRKRTENMLS